jgi:predicted membrane chloride channel (bestrophin family)
MTVLLYLFFLPFQLQQYLGWVAIPATAIASTVYLGFLEIGNQIEMPFAYDQSDLDLDKYVLKIAMQLAEITAVGLPFLCFRGVMT